MSEEFSKGSIKEKHRMKISEILQDGGGTEEIVNYILSRISNVISYERRKYERRILREWSKNYETKKSSGADEQ